MKSCPFCGSPAAAWPGHASEYVRGFPLCQHHMNGALKMAAVFEYDPHVVSRENARCSYERSLNSHIEAWADNIAPGWANDPDNNPILADIYFRATENISLFCKENYGEPLSERIDDEKIARWFSVRISDLARKSDVKRCEAKKEASPDSRCINYATGPEGFCDRCSRSKKMIVRATRDADKMSKIMEILRDD